MKRLAVSAVAVVLGLWGGSASAHGPETRAVGVLTTSGLAEGGFAGDDARPDLVRTNIGLAASNPDGTYTYLCPSAYGRSQSQIAAAAPDRSLIVVLGSGGVYRSTDGGCAFSVVDLPVAAAIPIDVRWWQGRTWLLARTAEGSELVAIDEGSVERIMSWPKEGPGALIVDGFVSWGDADLGGFVVAGAAPEPAVWMGLSGDPWSWTQATPPATTADVVRIVPRAAHGSDVWLQLTEGRTRSLVRGVGSDGRVDGEPLVWSEPVGPFDEILGPVELDDRWVAVFDNALHAVEVDAPMASWRALEFEVDWHCLEQVGDVRYACAYPELMALEAFPAPGADAASLGRPVFRMDQLGSPREGCPPDEAIAPLCEAEWTQYGGQAGLADQEPWTSPIEGSGNSVEGDVGGDGSGGADAADAGGDVEGRGVNGAEGDTTERGGGCRVAAGDRPYAGVLGVALLLLGFTRVRRRVRFAGPSRFAP